MFIYVAVLWFYVFFSVNIFYNFILIWTGNGRWALFCAPFGDIAIRHFVRRRNGRSVVSPSAKRPSAKSPITMYICMRVCALCVYIHPRTRKYIYTYAHTKMLMDKRISTYTHYRLEMLPKVFPNYFPAAEISSPLRLLLASDSERCFDPLNMYANGVKETPSLDFISDFASGWHDAKIIYMI